MTGRWEPQAQGTERPLWAGSAGRTWGARQDPGVEKGPAVLDRVQSLKRGILSSLIQLLLARGIRLRGHLLQGSPQHHPTPGWVGSLCTVSPSTLFSLP